MSNIEYILDHIIDKRAREIYILRLEKTKYKDIASCYDIWIVRVRQIFNKTDEKVKDCLVKFKDIKL